MKLHLTIAAALALGIVASASALQTSTTPAPVPAGFDFECEDNESTTIFSNPIGGKKKNLEIELNDASDDDFFIKITPVDKDGEPTGVEPTCIEIIDGVFPEEDIEIPAGSKVSIEDGAADSGTKDVEGTFTTPLA